MNLAGSLKALQRGQYDLEEIVAIKKSRMGLANYRVKEMLGYRKLQTFDTLTLLDYQQQNIRSVKRILMNNISKSYRESKIEFPNYEEVGSLEKALDDYQQARLVLEEMERKEYCYKEQLQEVIRLRRNYRQKRTKLRKNELNAPMLEFMEMQNDLYETIFFGSEELLQTGMMYDQILSTTKEIYYHFSDLPILQKGVQGLGKCLQELQKKQKKLKKEIDHIITGKFDWDQQERDLYKSL